MAFTINTNIASLQSQEYLRVTSDLQQKTINRVTSGLRIISSGDDAAGLAIANSFRSDRSVLVQGARNANDGLSTLQTIDGGINNISQLLDRARTLAAQAASGTFTGDRLVLNNEFESVIDEIDRQAQAIGLNSGGLFARNLSVFIGGGRGETDADQIVNGSVSVNLSASTVDARSLGLRGLQVAGAAAADVDEILSDTTNTTSVAVPGFTDFYFRGPGFADDERVRVSVNLSGVDTADKLVSAVNAALEQAGSGGTSVATAFKSANIRASIVTNPDQSQELVFESPSAAFQVSAGDRLSNALLGNHTTNVGTSLDYIVTGGATTASAGTAFAAARDIVVRVQGGSLSPATDITLSVTTSTTVDTALTSLSSLVANNSALIAAGISVTTSTPGSALAFSSKRGENFEVMAVNDVADRLGLGTAQSVSGTGTAGFDVTSITSSGFATGSGAAVLAVSVGGGGYVTISHTFASSTAVADVIATLNNAFASNTSLQQAGLVAATAAGGQFSISSNNGTYFRVSSLTAGAGFGFGTVAGSTGAAAVSGASNTASATLNSGGASTSGLLAYSSIRNGGDDQTITVSAKDRTGAQQSLAITLAGDSGAQNGRTIDEAIDHINAQLQAAGSADLRRIVAVKERDAAAGGAEKIRLLSALPAFSVSVGSNNGGTGITSSQGGVVDSSLLAGGSNISIATQEAAAAAVGALALAVQNIGQVQATVGRGQNQFNFAIALAQTQLNSLAASESRIRDADLAAEAGNLAKAQVLLQAGIAALAQANVAPQAVLSLLQG
jgi:flagellin